MTRILVQTKKLHPEAKMPELGSEGAAGYDMFASRATTDKFETLPNCGPDDDWAVVATPGQLVRIGVGLAVAIPADHTMKLEARSGMSNRDWAVEGGRIDADYRGELIVLLRNMSQDAVAIKRGDKIVQAVLAHRIEAVFVEAQALPESNRAAGGFGSTGV